MVSIIYLTIFFYLHNLQDVYCTKMFLEMDKTIRFVDTEKNTNEVLISETASVRSWDYHHDRGYLYYVEMRPGDLHLGDLKRLNLKDKSVKSLPFTSDNLGELEIAVDYVRDELYVITGKDTVVKSDLDGQNRVDIMPFSDVKNNLHWKFGDVTPYTLLFNIDPYERVMFITYNCTNENYTMEGTVIMKADLDGASVKMHRGFVYYQQSTTTIDVSVPWFYIINKFDAHYHPYSSGDEIGYFPLKTLVPRLCDAFNQMFYLPLSRGESVHVYEFSNYTRSAATKTSIANFRSAYKDEDFCKADKFVVGCIGLGVKVYDPRRQRRMRDGKFECKKKDCGHGCEVRQDTGDTCTCPKNQVLQADGKTCQAVPCRIPDPPRHRVFARYPCAGLGCELEPGATVPHERFVAVGCDPGYFTVKGIDSISSDSTLSACNSGRWFPRFSNCVKLCPPLTSLTVKFSCYQGPRLVSCENPMLPGTLVEYSCKEYHDSNDRNHANGLTCTSLGEWSRSIPTCTPNCGRSNLNDFAIQPTIVGDTFSDLGNFPWHAGLYHKSNGTWEPVCGATLISPKAILTAAHCVTIHCDGCKATAMKPEDVMVALGKKYRSWDTTEKSQVKKRIKEIRVHIDYIGSTVNYGQDIAVLVMESEVEVTNYVMPACVDFSRNHVREFSEDKTLQGYVAGWGNTDECSSYGNSCSSISETLKYAKTTIISYIECFNLSQSLSDQRLKSHSRLTSDKFCSGNGTASVVQKGDSGGGMTFVFDGLHHIFGIVSLKLQLEVGDRNFYSFGAFTNVRNYLDWLKLQFYEI